MNALAGHPPAATMPSDGDLVSNTWELMNPQRGKELDTLFQTFRKQNPRAICLKDVKPEMPTRRGNNNDDGCRVP